MSSFSSTEEMTKIKERFNRKHLQEIANNVPMLLIGGHRVNFELSAPEDRFIQKASQELRETPEVVTEAYKELRELTAKEPDLLVVDDDDFYQIFLRPCKWYPQSAFSRMKRYYRFKKNHPHIFENLLPSTEKAAFCAGLVYPLPLRTEEGCRIVVIEVGKRWKPKEVSLEQMFKSLIFILHSAMAEPITQIAGARIIIDTEGVSLNHVTYFTPSFAKMIVDFVQKCLPFRLKSIHIVNQSFLFNMIFAFFKPFLEEKIRKRIYFHGTNWETLMPFIQKRVLLKKHGGDLEGPEEPFGITLWQLFCTFESYFEIISQLGYRTETNKK